MTAAGDALDLLRQASLLHGQGLLDAAESRYREILAAAPANREALLRLAIIRIQQARADEALALSRQVLTAHPGCAEAHSTAATALHILRRHEDAVAGYEEALAHDPGYAEAYFGLASALQALERHEEAVPCYERALNLEPDYVEAHCGRAASLHAMKRYQEALLAYDQSIAIDPDFAQSHYGRGNALQALQRDKEALGCYETALSLEPDHPQALAHLGRSLQKLGRRDGALNCFRRALEIMPTYAEAHLDLGVLLEELGRIDEARTQFERALALDPTKARAYYALFNSRPASRGEPHLAALEAQLEDHRTRNIDDQVLLRFALGKALAGLGENERAFASWSQGNALKRQYIAYDETAALDLFDRVKAVFTHDFLRSRSGTGDPSAAPIFIVGMPRSGSTLIEQILASHKDVFGGGELGDFRDTMKDFGLDRPESSFPEAVGNFSNERLRAFGTSYVARLSASAPAAARITDKTLANFCALGLIRLTLPNARIIHIHRDPVDTCLSCYSLLFSNEQPFTFDLGELGRYYAAYRNLMTHWRKVMPPGAMLDVRYEELVADFEPQARKILTHCGLNWDDACLEFHKTDRPVRTASVIQVRQPLYRSSVGRWRPGSAILAPLLEALDTR